MVVALVVLVIVLALVCLCCLYLLKRQQARLSRVRRSSRMKSVFIRALSREIRTSLHSVTGLAEIIAKNDLYLSKSEKKNISDQILYNSNLISTLLDEVSIFSRSGEGGHQLQDERFSPNQLCQRCIDSNRRGLKEGVRLVFKNIVGDSLFLSADVHIVELILNKLVSTACRFTEQGDVTVGYSYVSASRILTFFVQDTGVGIPVERKAKLFSWFTDPSVDVDPAEFDLSVAQRLAEKIGAYLRDDDTYNKGTRIEFVVPVRPA